MPRSRSQSRAGRLLFASGLAILAVAGAVRLFAPTRNGPDAMAIDVLDSYLLVPIVGVGLLVLVVGAILGG